MGYVFLALGESLHIPFILGVGFSYVLAGELLGVLEEFVTK